MDRLSIIKARVKQICDLPLHDREAIPHKYFMELTEEFLELNKQWKDLEKDGILDANHDGNVAGDDKAAG